MVSKARKTAAQASTNLSGRRNLLYNGDMTVIQRASSSAGLGAASGYFVQDRWKIATSTTGEGRFTMSQDAETPDGFANSMKIDCTTAEDGDPDADEYLIIAQRLEGLNLQQLKKGTSDAEPLTASFWVRSPKTGVHTVSLYDPSNTRNIGSTYTIASADTWEYHSVTFAGDTTGAIPDDNTEGLRLWFWLLAGSDRTGGTFNTSWASFTAANACNSSQVNVLDNTSNNFYLTGCQLEVGNSPTSFEFEEYAENLSRCYRYYYNAAGTKYAGRYSTGYSFTDFDFSPEMRAAPSILSYTAVRTTTGLAYYSNKKWFQVYQGATNGYITNALLDAEL